MVPLVGVEPTDLTATVSKTAVYTSSTTRANVVYRVGIEPTYSRFQSEAITSFATYRYLVAGTGFEPAYPSL